MEFNSLIFIFLFLPLLLFVYFILKPAFRITFLIPAGLFFYAWGQREAVFILIFLIIVNYFLSSKIALSKNKKTVKKIYMFGIVFNVLVLIFYKYITFLFAIFGINFKISGIPFPTGISFMTFLAISYLTDIFRGSVIFRKGIGAYALYISLFPKLITGPITVFSSFSSQLYGERVVKLDDFSFGVRRFIVGLGKKVLIADVLVKTVSNVFIIPADRLNASVSWIGILAYTLQIYYDFSGYSDMAIGLGRMLGYKIPENFNFPYIAESIKDFWGRWHITLGHWLKTYLFLPIAYSVMRRTEKDRILKIKIENWAYLTGIIVTFFLCGLWHGAAWTFVIWGLYYGILLGVEHLGVRKLLKRKLPRFFRIIVTQFFVVIGWVIFRSPDVGYFIEYLKSLFGFGNVNINLIGREFYLNYEFIFIMIIAIVGIFPISRTVGKLRGRFAPGFNILYFLGENIFYIFVLIGSIMAIVGGTYKPFIYFSF